MAHREFKNAVYEQFARVGHAIGSPRRLEVLDLLLHGEKTVEELAEAIDTPVKNTSAHLRVLRQARLVNTRKAGTRVFYRIADDRVAALLRAVQAVAEARLAEVALVTRRFIEARDALEPVTLAELRRRIREGSATVVDVRPRAEFDAGHIPGARSVPVSEIKRRLKELPRSREVIAYCRGPYCLFSVDAVAVLRRHGFRARRADAGVPEWRGAGYPVALGTE